DKQGGRNETMWIALQIGCRNHFTRARSAVPMDECLHCDAETNYSVRFRGNGSYSWCAKVLRPVAIGVMVGRAVLSAPYHTRPGRVWLPTSRAPSPRKAGRAAREQCARRGSARSG